MKGDGKTGAANHTRCPSCGARRVGGLEGCHRLFEDLMNREFSQPELFRVHRLTVDCYSMQHPEKYMVSAKSWAAHVTGMCWSLEGDDGYGISVALSRWLDGNPSLPKLDSPPPGRRGELTVHHVHSAPDSAAHVARIGEWAASIWDAWAEHHDQAREWVRDARSRARGGRGA
jgi:hypothetical protein